MTFRDIDKLALEVLWRSNVKCLPVDLHIILDRIDTVRVHSFDWAIKHGLCNTYPSNDGVLMRSGLDSIILYNKNHHIHRIRWTIAHELGHLFLDHRCHSDGNEWAANRFARYLLMPLPVLKQLGIVEPYHISKVCKVSFEAATYAATEVHECLMYTPILYHMSEYMKEYNDMVSCFREVTETYRMSYAVT